MKQGERDGPSVPLFCPLDVEIGIMKRIGLLTGLCLAVMSSVGCVYSPGYMDPYTGVPRGGTWQPVCGGPADPLGIGCAVMYGNPNGRVPYNYSYPHANRYYNGGWQPTGDPCCEGTAMPMHGPPQTFAPGSSGSGCNGCMNNAPMHAPGNMTPTPDPKGSKSGSASGGAMTNVYPPQAPPALAAPIQNASHLPAVQAH